MGNCSGHAARYSPETRLIDAASVGDFAGVEIWAGKVLKEACEKNNTLQNEKHSMEVLSSAQARNELEGSTECEV